MAPEYIDYLDTMYEDTKYKEVDGIYIVYQGHVDVLTADKNHKLINHIGIFEHFGDSKILKKPSHEYFGDLYAGLYPVNPHVRTDLSVGQQFFR